MNRFIGRGLPFKQLSIQLTRVRDGSPVRLTELQLHPKKSPSFNLASSTLAKCAFDWLWFGAA